MFNLLRRSLQTKGRLEDIYSPLPATSGDLEATPADKNILRDDPEAMKVEVSLEVGLDEDLLG